MKVFKKIAGGFFVFVSLIVFSILSSACEDKSLHESKTVVVAAEVNNSSEKEEKSPVEEEKVYISTLSIPNKIHLSNNGVGINFIVEYFPLNATENILIEIENQDIVNFGTKVPEEKRGSLVDFTIRKNILYPLSVGETNIIVRAKSGSGEEDTIEKTCTVIVENAEEAVELRLCDEDSDLLTELKSGQTENGEYKNYSAKVLSKNRIEDKELGFVKSSSVVIDESSFVYSDDEEGYKFSFDFYLIEEGSHDIQIVIENNFLNAFQKIYSQKIEMPSKNIIEEEIDLPEDPPPAEPDSLDGEDPEGPEEAEEGESSDDKEPYFQFWTEGKFGGVDFDFENKKITISKTEANIEIGIIFYCNVCEAESNSFELMIKFYKKESGPLESEGEPALGGGIYFMVTEYEDLDMEIHDSVSGISTVLEIIFVD